MDNSVSNASGVYAGVDVGGTNVVCGLVDADGRLLATVKRPTEADRGGDALVSKIADMTLELLAGSAIGQERLKAVGVGFPGFLDPIGGIVKFAANLNLTDYPIADRLGKLLGVPVSIDNDVRMYMFGEAKSGAAAGYNHILGVTVGTGIAAAVINHGELLYGAGYLAGEIGHFVVEGNPYVCGCGLTGCLETLVSAGGIVRQAKDRMRTEPTVLNDWFPERSGRSMAAADVARAYDLGDPVAIDVFERTGTELGKALSVAATLISPDIVVVGGGVSLAGERLLAPLRRTLKERTHPMYGERIVVAQAKWTDEAGIIGSAAAARLRSGEI